MDGSHASAPVYEIWHLDEGIPTRLSTREQSTDADRVMRREPRSVIVRQGVVIRQRADVTPGQAHLLRVAAAKAWADAGGVPPEPPPTPDANAKPSKARGPSPVAFGRRARPKERPLTVPSPDDAPPVTPAAECPPPKVVVRRKPIAPEVPAVPAAATTCPCGALSAPTAQRGGRPSTPEFADLCKMHRTSALGRLHRGTSATPSDARDAALASTPVAAAKPARKAKRPTTKRVAKTRAVVAPIGDLLATLRRQRAVVDALGGLDAAEAHVAMVERVGAEQLAAIVDELTGAA